MRESLEPPTASILLLAGPPAAGKSRLARKLLQTAHQEIEKLSAHKRNWVVHHIEFDEVLQSILKDKPFEQAAWHRARNLMYEAVKSKLTHHSSQTTATRVQQLSKVSHVEMYDKADLPPQHLIILDDNMQYRSMRRTYFRLARDSGAGFFVLALRVPLKVALERNRQRCGLACVPEATLMHMAEIMQWPDASCQGWEKNAMVVEHGDDVSWGDFFGRLREAPQPFLDDAFDRAADATITASSARHQLDLRLRRITSMHLQAPATLQLPKVNKAALAQHLSRLKQQILLCVRAGDPTSDSDDECIESIADEADASFAAAVSAHVAEFHSKV